MDCINSFLKRFGSQKQDTTIELVRPNEITRQTSTPANVKLPVESRDSKLQLFVSNRFDMIDAYVTWEDELASKTQYRYEVSYQNVIDDKWLDCDQSLLQVVPDCKGVLCTIINLEPSASYRVKAKVVSQASKPKVLAQTQALNVTTGKPLSVSKQIGYQAMYDFASRKAKVEMSLVKEEQLLEESSHEMPPKDGYIYVRKVASDQRGYVPSSYISPLKSLDFPGVITAQDCYFNVNRRTAMVWLLRPNVPSGRFIIRPSSNSSCKALSVRAKNRPNCPPMVHHYKIFLMKDGYGCYVTRPSRCFVDINELIKYYKEHTLLSDENCMLTEPFPKYPHPPKLEDIAIPGEMIKLGSYLGNGHFGQVYKATFNGFEVAAKQLKRTGEPEADGTMSELMVEAEAMAALFHENVVRIIGVCCNEEPQTIVVEYMNKGNLTSYLQNDSEVYNIKLQEVLFLCSHITKGMSYLEHHNVIHRDLRTANVLLHEESGVLEVKVADFGLTRRLNPDEDIYKADRDVLMPVRWAAPECLENQQFSTKSDVWAFGVLFYEIVTLGTTPYPEVATSDVHAFIKNGGKITLEDCRKRKRKCRIQRTLPDEEICPEALFSEVSRCWLPNPEQRPTFEALVDLFDSFDFEPTYN